eukprot:TRINITY_DN5075_c2_g4_i1.p1 TRINITY_DN5075_c2_g4~~TRINITY_DN5075_c2_g4_i1.p1  ORF type:complete len:582 (+),score=85.92 TRINITY_DN5075_c2_g4_i1:60-1805(+)
MPRPSPLHCEESPLRGTHAFVNGELGALIQLQHTLLEQALEQHAKICSRLSSLGVDFLIEHRDNGSVSPKEAMQNGLQHGIVSGTKEGQFHADSTFDTKVGCKAPTDLAVDTAFKSEESCDDLQLTLNASPTSQRSSEGGTMKTKSKSLGDLGMNLDAEGKDLSSKILEFGQKEKSQSAAELKVQAHRELLQSARSSRLGRLVTNPIFESFCLGVIAINAVFMGVDAQYQIADAFDDFGNQEYMSSLFIVECVFFAWYCTELVLNVSYFRTRYFEGPEKYWHIFEAMLVCLSALDFIGVSVGGDFMMLRILKFVTKLVKAMRMVRVVKFCHEIRLILVAIASSMSMFSWFMVTLLGIVYMAAVIFVQGVALYLLDTPSSEVDPRLKENANVYFGSVAEGAYTVFKGITGGSPWGGPAEVLREASTLYFTLFVIFNGFLHLSMLKVLTGIFNQKAKEAFECDRKQSVEMNMRELFNSIDQDKSGSITDEEFMEHLDSSMAHEFLDSIGFDLVDLAKLMYVMNKGDDGLIDIEEFVGGCTTSKGHARTLDLILLSRRIEDIARHLSVPSDKLGIINDVPDQQD